MQREYRKWKSPSLGRDMEMLIFGKEGTPVLIFPSDNGRFFEWEDQGVIASVQEQIEEGYNQFFCLDSICDESLLNADVDPYTRIMRHKQYLSYIMEEVVPFVSEINHNPYLINTGTGLGAYYSLLLALKHPASFDKVIAFSGYFDIKPQLDGFYDDNVYLNNPVDFIPNLNDEKMLNQLGTLDIRLLNYQNDVNREATWRMSETLWLKFIDHQYYVWDESAGDPWTLIPAMFKEHLI